MKICDIDKIDQYALPLIFNSLVFVKGASVFWGQFEDEPVNNISWRWNYVGVASDIDDPFPVRQ